MTDQSNADGYAREQSYVGALRVKERHANDQHSLSSLEHVLAKLDDDSRRYDERYSKDLGNTVSRSSIAYSGDPCLVVSKAPPALFIVWALSTGNVFPDESNPLEVSGFHRNSKGYDMGHTDHDQRQRYFDTMNATLAKFGCWDNLDIHTCDADFTMNYGDHVLGRAFPFEELKPMLEQERQKMADSYASAFDEVRTREKEAWVELISNPKYTSASFNIVTGNKYKQPENTFEGVYAGSIAAMTDMWTLTQKIAAAGNSTEIRWSLKKLLRANKKVFEKYDRQPNQLTDVARTSIVLATLRDLINALDCALALGNINRIKNRFLHPEVGYADILLNPVCPNGFIVEIQLHLAPIYKVKGEAGHRAFRWFRRLVNDDHVYDGARNSKGEMHGWGTFMAANGDVYEGQWVNDKKEGEGTYTDAEGHHYVGSFRDDKREGECTFTYFDGSNYKGSYVNDKKEGYGTFTYADGQKYQGQWKKGKRNGKGIFWYADKSKYDGEWVMHKRHGQGTLYYANGETREGIWKDGELEVGGSDAG